MSKKRRKKAGKWQQRAKKLYRSRIEEIRKEKEAQRKQGITVCHPEYGKKSYNLFYNSQKWRELRYLALRNSGGVCQCCGAKASDGVKLHVDHIFPRSKYPKLELSLDNVQVLCEDCNFGKGNWDTTNWKQHFESI